MYLLRLITLDNLINNHRVFVRFVRSIDNDFADVLSRLQLKCFWEFMKERNMVVDSHPSLIASAVWPVSQIWKCH